MRDIQIVGQSITSTNYATRRLFNFNPELVKEAAIAFLNCGINEIEIPQGVLDPNNDSPETGVDEETLKRTIKEMPSETVVIATYIGGGGLGQDNEKYLKNQSRALDNLTRFFPDMQFAALHPAPAKFAGADEIKAIVATYAKLAEHAVSLREDFQLCFHNHYDSNAESVDQVRMFLDEIEKANHPALRWGPDTGHSHGMGDQYIPMFEKYAHLIGDYFHIKARIAAFDKVHGGEAYREERDIWSNQAEKGSGLYSGFVNVADPEIETPFEKIFPIIRKKSTGKRPVIRGAVEIDNPRQHPRLESLCFTLYLKHVHGLKTGIELSNDEIVSRVFGRK